MVNSNITEAVSSDAVANNLVSDYLADPILDEGIEKVVINNLLSDVETTYTIKSGDSLSKIADQYGTTLEAITSAQGNEWLDSRTSEDGSFILIKPGETLNILEASLGESLKVTGENSSQTIYNYEGRLITNYDPETGWSYSDWDLNLPDILTMSFDDEFSTDFGFDNSAWDGTGFLDNSLLDFESEISPTSNNAGINPDAWEEGSALHGGDYSANMPIDVINGPGLTFEQLSKNITDDFQPGDMILTDNHVDNMLDQSINFLQDNLYNPVSDAVGGAVDFVSNGIGSIFAGLTNLFTEAPKVERVDPLVIDLNGEGVQLVSFKDSTVTFDVDNDGYAENTGWVSKTWINR